MIDSHCHLADEAFAADLDGGRRARARGGPRAALCASSRPATRRKRRGRGACATLWPDVRFAVGVHPHQAGAFAGDRPRAADAVA